MADEFNNDSLLELYLYESSSLLDSLDDILLKAEASGSLTSENVNEVFRIMHTIKGSSAMMAYTGISEVAHKTEDLFTVIRNSGLKMAWFSELFDLMLTVSDFLKTEITKIQERKALETDVAELTSIILSLNEKMLKDAPAIPAPNLGRILGSPFSAPPQFKTVPETEIEPVKSEAEPRVEEAPQLKAVPRIEQEPLQFEAEPEKEPEPPQLKAVPRIEQEPVQSGTEPEKEPEPPQLKAVPRMEPELIVSGAEPETEPKPPQLKAVPRTEIEPVQPKTNPNTEPESYQFVSEAFTEEPVFTTVITEPDELTADISKITARAAASQQVSDGRETWFLHIHFYEGSKMENIRAYMLVNILSEKGDVNKTIPANPETDPDAANRIIENGFYLSFTTSLFREQIETIIKGTLSVESVSFVRRLPEDPDGANISAKPSTPDPRPRPVADGPAPVNIEPPAAERKSDEVFHKWHGSFGELAGSGNRQSSRPQAALQRPVFIDVLQQKQPEPARTAPGRPVFIDVLQPRPAQAQPQRGIPVYKEPPPKTMPPSANPAMETLQYQAQTQRGLPVSKGPQPQAVPTPVNPATETLQYQAQPQRGMPVYKEPPPQAVPAPANPATEILQYQAQPQRGMPVSKEPQPQAMPPSANPATETLQYQTQPQRGMPVYKGPPPQAVPAPANPATEPLQFYVQPQPDIRPEPKQIISDFDSEPNSDDAPAANAAAGQNIISVELKKLDAMLDLVGEIVINESIVTKNPDLEGLELTNFRIASRHLGKLTNELQDTVMSIRMLPVSIVFQRMRRIIRDMSKSLGKDVHLILAGDTTEVDKTILDALSDPIMHIVRNAMDHAIETPQERIAAGKSPVGHIVLSAQNTGSDVIISVSDDGMGLDKNMILNKARINGLLRKPDNEYSDREIFNLLLSPGFSTRDSVSEFSGRGVGLDVVKSNIDKIGGTIIIESKLGIGSNIILKIPLTLAVISCIDIAIGKGIFSIPISNIREVFKSSAGRLVTNPSGGEMVILHGQAYPIMRLHKMFGIPDAVTDIAKGVLVLVEAGGLHACILADKLIGKYQAIVKPLPQYLNRFKAKRSVISGCTVTDNGNISLIVNIQEMVR